MLGAQIGKYRITREIGRGGMGAVYEAVHDTIGQRVAVKVLFPEHARDPRLLDRFFDEARVGSKVNHPGVVRVFDHGHLDDQTAYILMEHLAGETLIDRMAALGRLPPADALRIGRQIASALAAVHAEHILHRDLKPANVMLVPEPEALGEERIKLLDFGIAKFRAEAGRQTTRGVVLGTVEYMAPERCQGQPADDKADVYSLGVMLYEMLGGRLPFDDPSVEVILRLQIAAPPPPLREQAPWVPEAVARYVCEELMAKSAARRPAMAQVVERLRALEKEVAENPLTQQVISMPLVAGGDLPASQRVAVGTAVAPTVQTAAGGSAPGPRTLVPATRMGWTLLLGLAGAVLAALGWLLWLLWPF
jgi:serine/threonine-protein kinase